VSRRRREPAPAADGITAAEWAGAFKPGTVAHSGAQIRLLREQADSIAATHPEQAQVLRDTADRMGHDFMLRELKKIQTAAAHSKPPLVRRAYDLFLSIPGRSQRERAQHVIDAMPELNHVSWQSLLRRFRRHQMM
jgi:hypothetical protein